MAVLVETADRDVAAVVARSGRHLQRYSTSGGRLVVGCIPYRFTGGKMYNNCIDQAIEVLVISSQKGHVHGIMFPKGGWELDESIENAACREAMEEAGVRGNVQDCLGQWSFKSKRYGTYYDGYMFPLLVTEQLDLWPEKHVRHRSWVSVAEARESCRHGWMKEALETFVSRLSSSVGLTTIEGKIENQLL